MTACQYYNNKKLGSSCRTRDEPPPRKSSESIFSRWFSCGCSFTMEGWNRNLGPILTHESQVDKVKYCRSIKMSRCNKIEKLEIKQLPLYVIRKILYLQTIVKIRQLDIIFDDLFQENRMLPENILHEAGIKCRLLVLRLSSDIF
jgi:hypothetical protein